MVVTIPDTMLREVEFELASGEFQGAEELIAQAVCQFLDERRRSVVRLETLRRLGDAVDQHGFYENAVLPD